MSPVADLSPENKIESPESFPKLKLLKDERARIACLEKSPTFEWVHTLRMPSILNGEPVYREGARGPEQEFDFVGRPICIGDYDIIADKGVDPGNCPMCRASVESDQIKPPERRFAMHVMRYATQPGGFTLAEPFTVTTLVWAFANSTFDKLVDFATEWDGGLQKHDLLLGPCTAAQFQKFDIAVAQQAAWLTNEATKQRTVETYKGNQAKDLSVFCGRKVGYDFIVQDLEKIAERWAILRRGQQAAGPDASEVLAGAVDDSALDDLLSVGTTVPIEATPAQPEQAAPVAPEPVAPNPTPDPAPAAVAPVEPSPAPVADTTPAPTAPTESFDDLLASLD